MKTSLVLGFLFFSSLAFAGPSITVTVMDQELGTPLEGVRLQVAGSAVVQTGPDGVGVVSLPPGSERLLLVAQLPGYEIKKAAIAPGDQQLLIKMLLSGVVEGHELVVERPKPQKTDAQAGVSETLSKQDLTNTAKIGIVEDALSSVKTLPGVGYTNFIGGRPSIRGGDPNETTATLDGAYVLYPYHWGGAFSIFNPDMVDSVKLNDGIVSARYGQTLSALLEVNSITPDQDQAHWDLGMSTIGTDFFLQTPLTNNAALLLGGKLTDLSYILNALGAGGVFSQAPYIKEGFGKLTWNPSPSLKTFVNGYWGVDGVGVANDSIDKAITTNQKFAYDNSEVLVSGGAKILLDDNNLLDFLVSFNRYDLNVGAHTVTNGTKLFDSDFIATYHPLNSGFTLNDLTNDFTQDKTEYMYQTKADWDWQAAPGQVFSLGQESLFQFWTSASNINGWRILNNQYGAQYTPVTLNTHTDGQKTATEGLYAAYNFTILPGTLTGEAGLRVDDSVVFNDQMLLQTQPAVNPRVLVTYTPVKDWGVIRSLSILGGSGLFSQFPFDNPYIDKKYGVSDFSIGPERAWFNEVGTEILTQDDWKIDVTGYWKSYYGRFFATYEPTTNLYSLHTDGTGNAYGFDVYFQKHTRYWDTSLAYSFIVSRLYDPGNPNGTAYNVDGNPLGTWYYPDYQRFHNVSFVGTINPNDGFSITTEAQVASGTPLQKVGPATSYEASMNGTPVEFFSRTSTYDDNLRIGWSYPVSVKFSWHDFYSGSKIRWEFYLGVQDIFAMLYTKGIQGNPPVDQWYGSDLSGTSGASFSSGIPIPSVGFNMGY